MLAISQLMHDWNADPYVDDEYWLSKQVISAPAVAVRTFPHEAEHGEFGATSKALESAGKSRRWRKRDGIAPAATAVTEGENRAIEPAAEG